MQECDAVGNVDRQKQYRRYHKAGEHKKQDVPSICLDGDQEVEKGYQEEHRLRPGANSQPHHDTGCQVFTAHQEVPCEENKGERPHVVHGIRAVYPEQRHEGVCCGQQSLVLDSAALQQVCKRQNREQ